MARTIVRPVPITKHLIALLRKQGAKPASGRGKLDFPTAVPAPWVVLADGSTLRAVEQGDELVAV